MTGEPSSRLLGNRKEARQSPGRKPLLNYAFLRTIVVGTRTIQCG
jgi:hypothetical protein